MKKTPKLCALEWRTRNPEYHSEYYRKNAGREKIRRFNKKEGTAFPDDKLQAIREFQEGGCAECGEELHRSHEYLFLTDSPPNLEIVCLKCRRVRRNPKVEDN
jgi:hypothetical protein